MSAARSVLFFCFSEINQELNGAAWFLNIFMMQHFANSGNFFFPSNKNSDALCWMFKEQTQLKPGDTTNVLHILYMYTQNKSKLKNRLPYELPQNFVDCLCDAVTNVTVKNKCFNKPFYFPL